MTKVNVLMPESNIHVIIDNETQNHYISLTDIALRQGSPKLLDDWLKNKNTIEFLAAWERLNNPEFDETGFKGIWMEAGLNRFRLSVTRWNKETNGIGIAAKRGKGGGTMAHEDIALEFAGWLSPELRLYIISEFKRLKRQENLDNLESAEWSVQRLLSKMGYRVQTDAIKEHIISPDMSKYKQGIIYASEADLLNLAVFGMTAKEWRDANPDLKENIRRYASVPQLTVLSQLESQNALLIKMGVPQQKRLEYLCNEAQRRLTAVRPQEEHTDAQPPQNLVVDQNMAKHLFMKKS